jgi:hypothetical protein
MLVLELAIFGAIFYFVYQAINGKQDDEIQDLPETGVKEQQILHQYRQYGVNREDFRDEQRELFERGLTLEEIPEFSKGVPDAEVAAKIVMLMQQTPKSEMQLLQIVPGEDKVIPRTTMQTDLQESRDLLESKCPTADDNTDYAGDGNTYPSAVNPAEVKKPKEKVKRGRERRIKRKQDRRR